MARNQDRRLEVVVLAGRSLSPTLGHHGSASGGRRKVQLTLVSAKDPKGEAYGAKVSPWTEPLPGGKSIRFGASGLRCSFPLSSGHGAPAIASDVRFTESAHLRVRMLASAVPTVNSMLKTATDFMPTVAKELDEATAQYEGAMHIPLANILSGRVGFMADRALGGWLPLQRLDDDVARREQGDEEPPLSLWMQMYVLPDHEAMLPTLQAQLDEFAQGTLAGGAKSIAALAGSPASGKAAVVSAATQPRWGPTASGPLASRSNGGAQATKGSAPEDLLDLSTGDDLIDISLSVLGGVNCTAATAAAPSDSLLDLGADLLGGTALLGDDLPRLSSVLAPADAGPGDNTSAFGFIAAAASASSAAPFSDNSSAFGFVAAASQSPASLDLAALYNCPSPAPAASPNIVSPVSQARFTALASLHPGALAAPTAANGQPLRAFPSGHATHQQQCLPQQPQEQKSLQSLESTLLAGLSQSLRF